MTCLGRGDGDGAAAATARRRRVCCAVVWWRSGRDGRVCVAATARRRRVCCVMRLAAARQRRSSVVAERARRGAAGASPAMLVFDAARRALTNCLKGWTITALTSDMVAALRVAAVAVAIWVAAATAQPAELRLQGLRASIYSSSGLLLQR